jgi:hypothetical protein
MKTLLVQTGWGGRRAVYLREQGIPRATADRLVRRHEELLMAAEQKRTSDAISAPTEDKVHAFFERKRPAS